MTDTTRDLHPMTNQITLEEALKLVQFKQGLNGSWYVENVKGDAHGSVAGNVGGHVGGDVGLFHIDETSDRVCLADGLRSARRPKPPSLKKQALEALDDVSKMSETLYSSYDPPEEIYSDQVDIIRRALEALPDD